MAVRLEWSNCARRDLLDIYVKIGLDNPSAAERFYERIEKRAAILREEPRLGPRRDDIRARLRMLVENPYLIFYKLMPDAENEPVEVVEILRVLDGRRDLLRLL